MFEQKYAFISLVKYPNFTSQSSQRKRNKIHYKKKKLFENFHFYDHKFLSRRKKTRDNVFSKNPLL